MLLYALLGAAHALSCEEITSMLQVGVPEKILVQTVIDGGPIAPEVVACLQASGVPASVLAAARGEPVPGTSPRVDPPPPRPPPPPLPMPPGVSPAVLDDPHAASLALVARLRGASAEDAAVLQVWLGRSYLALHLPQAAGRAFLASIDQGGTGIAFADAWDGLVTVAAQTGDEADLSRLVTRIPLEAIPPPHRAQYCWLLGRRLYEAASLADARKVLDQIPESSPWYRRGMYLQGVIFETQGKMRSGIRAFREVAKTRPQPARRGDEQDPLAQDAALNIARVFYSIERYEEAGSTYALVTGSGPRAVQARYEATWAAFMRGDTATVTAHLAQLRQDAQVTYLPALPVLEAIVAFVAEDPQAAVAKLQGLDALGPAEAALTAAVAAHPVPPATGSLYRDWLAPDAAPPVPRPLLDALRSDAALQSALAHLDALDQEARRLKRQPRRWREALGGDLERALDADRVALQARAESSLLTAMGWRVNELRELQKQAEIITFEAALEPPDRQAERLRALLAEAPEGEWKAELRFRLAEQYTSDPRARVALLQQALAQADYARNDEVTLSLARVWWELGERAQAVAALEHLVATWPESGAVDHAWLLLGDDAFERRDWALARERYLKVGYSYQPGLADIAAYRLAWCTWAQGRYADARMGMAAVVKTATDPVLHEAANQDLIRMEADLRAR